MTKFLIGLVSGIILTVVTGFIAVFSLARFGAERKPSVPDNAVLVMNLGGELPERAPVEFPIPFFESQTPVTMLETWDVLRKAAADSRIRAIVLEPRGLAIGWGKLQEIRAGLEQFRKSRKPVIAYLKSPRTPEYYLATAADRIYIAPEEFIDVKGLRAEMTFYRGTLDKVGVQIEIEHAGKYKDYGDMFTRTKMTPETREVLDSVLDDLFGHLLTTIGPARRKSPDQMRALIDEGPFLAGKALKDGLVDGLLYEDQMFDEVKSRLKVDELKKVSFRDYARVPASSLGLEGGARIAVVTGDGGIVRGGSGDDGMSDDGISSEGFDRTLRRVAEDASIKGVVVRIDSPGGDAIASDDIWREMNVLSKKKPMVISMSDVAASGGYYMAMTGDPIVAYPATFTGSIGVVFGKANLRGLYDKIGVTKEMLTRGRFAGVDSEYGPLTPEAKAKLREGIDSTYHAFVSRVAQARKRKFDEVEPLSQGRVWLGSQAKRNGLIDELGGIDRALELLKVKAKLPKDEKLTLVMFPGKRSILDLAFGHSRDSEMDSLLRGVLKKWQVTLWKQGGLMRLMPYSIEVR